MAWPKRELWVASAETRPAIQWPSAVLSAPEGRVEQDRVVVTMQLLDRPTTRTIFHVDLVGQDIQPLLLTIDNHSDHPYRFRKADIGQPVIPAEAVAKRTFAPPLATVMRYLRWLAFLGPGVVMETMVEPATTFDFPGIEEAAERPVIPEAHRILAEFAQQELADGDISPRSTRAGLVFVRSVKLSSLIPITLTDAQTQQPLRLDVPTPPAVYEQHAVFAHPATEVWEAADKVLRDISAWRVISRDQSNGIVTIRSGGRFFFWSTITEITVTIHESMDHRTEVTLRSPLHHPDGRHYGEHNPAIDTFFHELEIRLPNPPPPKKEPTLSGGASASGSPTRTDATPAETETALPASSGGVANQREDVSRWAAR